MANQGQQRSWVATVILAASATLLIDALLWAMIWPNFLYYWPWPVTLLIPLVFALCLALVGMRLGWSPRWPWYLIFGVALALILLALATGTYLPRKLPWVTAASGLFLLVLPLIAILRRMRGSQWLLALLVLLALGLYAGSLIYQAGSPARDARYLTWTTPQVLDNTTRLSLVIAYPPAVLLEAHDESGWPLSVYLWPPVLPSTPTPTSTMTPTVRTVLSYTVAFTPVNEGLIFINKEGVPVPPNIKIEPGQTADKPAVLFLRRVLTSTVSVSVPLTAYLYDSNGILQGQISLEVQLEDTYGAWWRHLWGIVLGPTTPLLALAAALVGFGWQWWQEGQKRRQTALEEINQVEILANQDETEPVERKLEEVTVRYGREPGLQDDLRKARLVACRARIRRLGILASTGPKEDSLHEEESLRKELEDGAQKDAEFTVVLGELNEAKLAIEKRAGSPWPRLWRPERPPDAPAIDQWREQAGLEFNPFGPERAEEDPRLLELIVEPPGWELISAPEPTVIFGLGGSGRTASRLFLAHTCTTTKLARGRTNGRPFDTLAVSFFVFPGGDPAEAAAVCWRALTYAMAQASLDFLARNPGVFSETPADRQRALARVFTMHRHSLGDPAGYLLGAGLDRPIALHLGDRIRQAARGTRSPPSTDEAELLSILAQARLLPFQQSYILVEVPDQVHTWFQPEEIASHMNALLHIIPSLAARGVYLKLFIPADVKTRLQTLPSGVDEIELSWDETALQRMLEQRVQRAGAATFRSLFERVPRGADPTMRLAQAAFASEGPPRRLIQLGQELLVEHIRRSPNDPRLHWEELNAVLGKMAQGRRL